MKTIDSIEKVLFLDIDGVLNRAEYGKDLYEDTYRDYCVCLHRPSVEALRKLLAANPSIKVVWMTDWAKSNASYTNSCHSYLDPKHALEQFTWLSSRIAGSIFTGKWSHAIDNDKMLAVNDFIKDNLVESFAIVDDATYKLPQEMKFMSKHIIKTNPLKSFLEDDLPLVNKALSLPVDGEVIHSILLRMEHTDSFVVNNRYHCKFDFSTYCHTKAPLFTAFEKELSCPRMTAKADVLVYDERLGENMLGMVSLNIDTDLGQKDATLCIKHLGFDHWESMFSVLSLSKMKKIINA